VAMSSSIRLAPPWLTSSSMLSQTLVGVKSMH
jgi:hypothetical protein